MKVYRFMSKRELERILAGETLVSDNKACSGSRTTSSGFCFIPERVTFMSGIREIIFTALQCYEFLAGIVSYEAVVEFETTEESNLSIGHGVYADPCGSFFATVVVDELWTPSYSKATLIPKRVWFGEDFFVSYSYDTPNWQDIT